MRKAAIIVAGGAGRRMGGEVPKQFLELAGKPLLCCSMWAFHKYDPKMEIVVVLPKEHINTWRDLCDQHGFMIAHKVVEGGAERYHSVRNGLSKVNKAELIAVHDGVRPMVSVELIDRCMKAAEDGGASVPVIPISSSIRKVEGYRNYAVERDHFRQVQTPQCFQVSILQNAFEQPYESQFTDEATLVERAGDPVAIVKGDPNNIKVTTPIDLVVAEALLKS